MKTKPNAADRTTVTHARPKRLPNTEIAMATTYGMMSSFTQPFNANTPSANKPERRERTARPTVAGWDLGGIAEWQDAAEMATAGRPDF